MGSASSDTTAVLADHPCWTNHPVCGVSWYEAEAYARFVVSGYLQKQNGKQPVGMYGVRRTYPGEKRH